MSESHAVLIAEIADLRAQLRLRDEALMECLALFIIVKNCSLHVRDSLCKKCIVQMEKRIAIIREQRRNNES